MVNIRSIIASPNTPNRKVGLLAHLSKAARYPILVASDSDMRVTPDYLRRVITPLEDPSVGLVTCPYCGEKPLTLTARLEALYMGITFLPSMLVGRKVLKMRFAMGATVAMRKRDLERIGGYSSIGSYLADDYEIGFRMAKSGLRVQLSDYVVHTILGPTTFADQWEREVRWAHCNRASRPLQYPGLLISFSTPLAAILAVITGFQTWALLMLTGSLLIRWMVGLLVTRWTGDKESRHWWFWLPVRDFLTALIWCGGVVGRRVIWRGEVYSLHKGGILIPLKQTQNKSYWSFANPVRKAVRLLDQLLCRLYGIFEFNQDPTCIFRLSTHPLKKDILLPSGKTLHTGEEVAILHFWNEHMPTVPAGGADLAWGLHFRRQVDRSLQALADYSAAAPKMQSVVAFHGVPPFGSDGIAALPARFMERWGFELVFNELPQTLPGKFAHFWEKLYTMALVWAYNPGSLQGKKPMQLGLDEVWLTREALLNRYHPKSASQPQQAARDLVLADKLNKGATDTTPPSPGSA